MQCKKSSKSRKKFAVEDLTTGYPATADNRSLVGDRKSMVFYDPSVPVFCIPPAPCENRVNSMKFSPEEELGGLLGYCGTGAV